MERMKRAADLLAEARFTNRRWAALPEDCRPSGGAEAYAVQDELVKRLISEYGGYQVGYKIACTNRLAQEFLKLNEPFYGRLLSPFVHTSPARADADEFYLRIIEPEFAFRMMDDLPAGGGPFDQDQIYEAIGAVLPAIEIVDSRYDDWTIVGGPSLIADNGCNGAWVQGEAFADWRALDFPSHKVTLVANGKGVREGRGDAIMGHPINALTWLANMLARQGSGLKAGDLVSTGTCVDVYYAKPGDVICADFGAMGAVELTFKGP